MTDLITQAQRAEVSYYSVSAAATWESFLRRSFRSVAEYEEMVSAFNERIQTSMRPERSLAAKGPVLDVSVRDQNRYEAHYEFVTEVTQNAFGRRHGDHGDDLRTDRALKIAGRWSGEMAIPMARIADELFNELVADKPKGRKALMLGGLPGVGKSALLDSMESVLGDHWVLLDSDMVKERMLLAGYFPTIHGLTPAESVGFIHHQGSEIAHMIEKRLMRAGYNIIFDTTMGGDPQHHVGLIPPFMLAIQALKRYGYATPDGIFLDAPIPTAVEAVKRRHRAGLNAYRTGLSDGRRRRSDVAKLGGRFIPTMVFEDSKPNNEAFSSVNRENFNRAGSSFRRWTRYDAMDSQHLELVEASCDGSIIARPTGAQRPGFYAKSELGA
jgi:hypothetical protein